MRILFCLLVSFLLFLSSGCGWYSVNIRGLRSTDDSSITGLNLSSTKFIGPKIRSKAPFQGTCDDSAESVLISIENFEFSTSCVQGLFSEVVDLSSLVEGIYSVKLTSFPDGNSITETLYRDDTPPSTPASITQTIAATISFSPEFVWNSVDDLISGVDHYEASLGFSMGADDLLNWIVISPTSPLTKMNQQIVVLLVGQSYYVNVRAVDKAGNISNIYSTSWTVPASSSPSPSFTPYIAINYFGSKIVSSATVNIESYGPSSFTEIYLTNDNTCNSGGSWQSRQVTLPWSLNLASANSTASVYARFRTATGIESSCVSASVYLDLSATNKMCDTVTSSSLAAGRLTDSGGTSNDYGLNESCTFTITTGGMTQFEFNNFHTEAYSDYLTIYHDSVAPGNVLYELDGSFYPKSFSYNGTIIFKFASDNYANYAGFDLTWKTTSLLGSQSMMINNGDLETTSLSVVLSMTYSSNIKEMYITNDPSCSSGGVWENLAPTKPWTLSSDSSFKKSVFIKFKDLENTVTSCSSASIIYVNSQPIAQLYNLPQNGNSDEYLGVEVGGEYLASYKYKLGTTASTDCSLPAEYSAAGINPEEWIWDSLNNFGNESITLCVIGMSSNGVQQGYSSATSYSWTRSAISYIEVLGSARSVTEGNQNVQFTLYSKVAPLSPVTINYDFFGDLVDELGLTAGQVTLPAGQNSVNVSVPLVSNPAEGADKIISLGISSVTSPHGIGNSSMGNILVRDAQRATTASVLDFGYYGECQVLTNGDLVCTGSVGGGGSASKYAEGYKKLNVGTTFKEIITDQSYDCALSTNNELYCWGWGFDGNLGQGTNVDLAAPTKINGFTWKKVEAQQDWNVVCGIDINDNLYCWGDQTYTDGAVGIGTTTDVRSPALVDSPNKYAEINVTGGSYDSKVCGITTTGILKCWGHGPLGNGTTSNSNIPVTADAGTLYSKIFLKGISCGITVAGAVKCWNSNHLSPVVLDDSRVYTKVAAGSSLCALTNLGQIYCFGTSPDFQSPILVDSQNTYTDLFALDYNRGMCALRSDQKVACWGTPTAGDNQKSYFSKTPVLWDEESYTRLKVTRKGICGITIYGYLKCISFPDYIRYANTEAPAANTETLLSYPSTINYKSVSNLCATDISDNLRCWKATQNSIDNTNYFRTNPVTYFPGETFQKISTKCGINGLGVLKCWGDGPLGDGTNNKSDSPIVIDPGVSYLKINVTNFNQRGGLTTTGDLKTWGQGMNSNYYNLGTGDKLERLSPTTILSNITNFSYNDSMGCAINTSGLLKCWGNAYTIKMGDGITEYSLSPVSISPGISFSDVSVSSQRVCAIRSSDHRVMCWGAGPVGDGTTSTRSAFTLTTDTSPYDRLEVGTLACGKIETVSTTKQIKCWGDSSKLSPTLVYTGSFRDMTWASGTLIIIDDNGKLFYLKKSFNVPGVPDASKFFQFVLGLVDRTLSILP